MKNNFWVNSKGSILANSKISNLDFFFISLIFCRFIVNEPEAKRIAPIHCSYRGYMTCDLQELGGANACRFLLFEGQVNGSLNNKVYTIE